MRQWLYERIVADAPLALLHQGRFFQGENLVDTITAGPRPLMFYTIGNDTSEDLADEDPHHRQFFTIYIHDVPADYMRIDNMVRLTKLALVGARSPGYGILTVRFLETSRDLDDETLGTIFRYVRFQAIMER